MENGNNLIHSFNGTDYYQGNFTGLTKREYFAGLAMQGIMVQYSEIENIAREAVSIADALLEELEKTKSE